MTNFNLPMKNSVRYSREQKVFHQLTNKDALLDALISLYNNTAKCQLKHPQESVSTFIQLYKPIYQEINKSKISIKDFKILNKDTFVEGAFGKVTIVKSIHDKKNIYAMKTLNKSHLFKQAGRSSPMEERLVLSNENEEWLPKLYASFQDVENLYLVMEYAHGGDLENLMNIRDYKFNEAEAKFYCAELILAVERVHQLGYMHRDIKPANILIDSKGHIKLGDLGCCISIDTADSLFPVGTALYMSPEMSDSTFGTTIYGAEADWWSVGIILYELLYGVTPFTGKVSDIQRNLMNPKVTFNQDIPVSNEAKDLITKLLLKSKNDRLGVKGGVDEIKAHPFFKDIDWKTLRSKATPPFIPSIKSLDDTSFFATTNNQEEDDDAEEEEEEKYDDELEEDPYREYPFIGYTYSCSLLNNEKSPTTHAEKRKTSDSQAFLAQFRQRMTLPIDSKQAEEEKNKLQHQNNTKIADLQALLDEKSKTLESLYMQIEKDSLSHGDKVLQLNNLLEEKEIRIKSQNQHIEELESKIKVMQSSKELESNDNEISNLNILLEQRNNHIEIQDQKITELESTNKELESNNKELESGIDSLIQGQKQLEYSLELLVTEKKELEMGLDEVKNNLMEQNNTTSNSLKARLAESQEKIVSLQTENDTLLNKQSSQEKTTREDISLLETENKQLFDENRDLNDQLFELERQIAELKEKVSMESKKTKELCQQYETKLKSQSIDYDLLIKQAKAECIELKNELSNLQHQSSTATRMKRANKSLPNIPTTSSPQISPEYSPGEGRSLILSTMWQRDRESLKNVQQALEESENKLAFAKRQVIRLKKEVKCFQKYTFEQQQQQQQSEKQLEKGSSDDFTALQNGMDYANKRPIYSKRMSSTSSVTKKTLLPKTPPQHAIDFSPTIHGISSFMDELNGKHTGINPSIKSSVHAALDDSQFNKKSITDADAAIMKEIKKEQNFISSTNRTIAARLRLSRTRGEIDQELEKSLQLSNKRLAMLENKLSVVAPPTSS